MIHTAPPTFTVVASDPKADSPRSGVYAIPQENFRLLQAVALAGGLPDGTETLHVVRAAE